jgi:pimeloyl-ACP methyl ester carboxylesterase
MNTGSRVDNVVLVHGGFVDGSGWQAVYNLLKKDGHNVSIVQNPTLSLEGDAKATRQIIDAQDGPVVLVGHSYGGAVITEAGNHDNVAVSQLSGRWSSTSVVAAEAVRSHSAKTVDQSSLMLITVQPAVRACWRACSAPAV